MKLKSLLAIVSCTAIALSISVPSVAETVKESQIKLEIAGIGNKDYRNKQNAPSMVGNWKSSVKDNEFRHTDPQEIYMDVKSDETVAYAFRREGRADGFNNSTYKYAPTKETNVGALVTKNTQGTVYISAIKWISNNEFVLTLIKDSREPHRNGLKRRFVRIQEPVATILQQRAQTSQKIRNHNAQTERYNLEQNVNSRSFQIITNP